MLTINKHISRIRNTVKFTTADARVTDRYIYLLMTKNRDFVVKRDRLSKLIYQDDLFQTKAYEELIEVDTVEACGIQSNCTIKRTKHKLPKIIEGDYGVIIRAVTSLDGTQKINETTSSSFQRKLRKSTYKYSKEKYFWYKNQYLYFPDMPWDAVMTDAYYEDNVDNDCEDCVKEGCPAKYDDLFRIPDYLVSSMDELILKELGFNIQIPFDTFENKNENIKQ